MGQLKKLVASALSAFAVLCLAQATQDTAQKDLPAYCSKGGEIDWLAIMGKAIELYQNYASKSAESTSRSPLEDILQGLQQKPGSATPKKDSEPSASTDAKKSKANPQPDISAALLGSLLSNLGSTGGDSQKADAANPTDSLKNVLEGLSALNGKGSSSGSAGADSLDLSKLGPLLLQGLPSLLGAQGGGSQPDVMSLLSSLMGSQQGGQGGLEKMFSLAMKSIFSPNRPGKDATKDGLESALSGAFESLLKAGLKEDSSSHDTPKDAKKSKSRH